MTDEFAPKDIAIKLFSSEPGEPSSVQFCLDEADNEYVFQILLNIFIEGLVYKKWIDLSVNPFSLLVDEDKFIKIKQYFRSIGFDVNYSAKEFNEYIGLTDEDYKNRYANIILEGDGENTSYTYGINLNFNSKNDDKIINDHVFLHKYIATFIDGDSSAELLYCISFSYYTA
ncbi:MAG: hypothetical protein Faunusvirus12_7 [Faunusvirus sp.]|jgi:hypothetical protein|uniref:Uncharacterized protein n=1 Tax=Faunusvirus sp. TaxID=2487766 RepID=A0A3G4ZYK0_9VIRU|nr:MAG: hypothetical protein Faunusvirus12_7 [Faunusvirus sp.]